MRLVVVSPHLDDGVWSVGALMHRWHRRGHDVVSLTVFGNSLEPEPASPWDEVCGFGSADAAAHARRSEDVRACRLVGAEPRWLDLPDGDHCDAHHANTVWGAVEPELDRADVVLVPGWPRRHPDHHWLGALLDERLPEHLVVAHYSEQPYMAMALERPGAPQLGPITTRHGVLHWHHHLMSVHERLRKARAVWAYRSQLRPQHTDLRRLARYELTTRTESVAWPEAAPAHRAALI